MNLLKSVIRLPGNVLIFAARMYQACLSPWLGSNCKFTPTCSCYFIEAIKKHGAIVGSVKTIWRILRCNPFNSGGYDPP